MTATRGLLAALLALTAGIALAQDDKLGSHELNNCVVEIRPDNKPKVQVYPTPQASPGAGAVFTIVAPVGSLIEMSDFTRTKDMSTPPVVRAVEVKAGAFNKVTFTQNGSNPNKFDLTIANGTSTELFPMTKTSGEYYEHGPFDYGYYEVRGPGGGIGGTKRTILVWFENRGLKSGFTLTDV